MKDQTGPCVKCDSTACKQFWPYATNDSYGWQQDVNTGSWTKVHWTTSQNLHNWALAAFLSTSLTKNDPFIATKSTGHCTRQKITPANQKQGKYVAWGSHFCQLTEMCLLVHFTNVIRHLAPHRQYAGMLTAMVNIWLKVFSYFCSNFDWQETQSRKLNNFQMWWLRVHKPNREWCNRTIS